MANSVRISGQVARDVTDRIDRVVLNRVLGIPIFLVMMYLMFMFTPSTSAALFIDFFDQLAGACFVDGFGELLAAWLPGVADRAVGQGIGGGLQTVATFIPGDWLPVFSFRF